ncbi:lantibiotic immunity ABC transporter MutG family permease subunit [Clostridiaceae bacterium M8S5]|nr:lantibiotic immunity ABC transporter MutG family permease subunit [Clostridiaceae bacterium M8S5]
MIKLYRFIKADYYKLKRTQMFWIHILIPIIGASVFVGYYSVSNWATTIKISAYFQTLAVSLPLLISLLCSMIISLEEQAGNFQELLIGSRFKPLALISKLIVLITGSLISITIALSTFAFFFSNVLKETNLPFSCYINVAIGLIVGNIFLYILHTYLSLRFTKGLSIGVGILGSLVSAIMVTGIGDKLWNVVPWAWGVRLCDYSVLRCINMDVYELLKESFKRGLINISAITTISLVVIVLWFSKWEGSRFYE